jgi:signal transduction histidine kinase
VACRKRKDARFRSEDRAINDLGSLACRSALGRIASKMKRSIYSPAKLTSFALQGLALALTIAIFIFDTATDLEIAVAVFYVAVVLTSVRFCGSRGVLLVSAGCMALTILSYFLTPSGMPESGLVNSIISLAAIGVTTYLALKIQSAEIHVLEARAQLAHVARLTALGELTASIAHEVNQPLAAVVTRGNACLRWLDGQTPNLDKAKQSVEHMIKDASRASDFVGRVRSLAKRTAPVKGWLDINEVIQEIIALTRGEIEKSHISLRAELADDLPLILGDRVMLQQVLLSLILNAIEAVNAASPGPREVQISSVNDPTNGIRVAIRDSGVGLEATKFDQVFDAFHTNKPGGMGIGLTISRSIIEAHGGWIWATANGRRGAVFQFTLPSGRSEAA